MFRGWENPLEFYNDDELKARYRFRRDTIMYILRAVGERLQRATRRSMALPAPLQLTVTLRLLACGSFLLAVSDTTGGWESYRLSLCAGCMCTFAAAGSWHH